MHPTMRTAAHAPHLHTYPHSPSGAGKTSLLNTLAGKAPYGMVTGEVLVNGRPDNLGRWRKVMGFVPQDDVMHSTLSVEVRTYQPFIGIWEQRLWQ